MMTSISRRAGILAASAMIAVLALSGCNNSTSSGGGGSQTNAAGQEVTPFDLKPGMCVDYDQMGAAAKAGEKIKLLDCAGPHTAEVYFEKETTVSNAAEAKQDAETVCAPAFAKYVGKDYNESDYGLYYFYPTAGSFSAGDRLITCMVTAKAPWSGLAQGTNK